jgi:hypothetical protein
MHSGQSCSLATVRSDAEKVKLMQLYNPAMQVKYTANIERCVCGKAPTLSKVRREYGRQCVMDWLRVQLLDYERYSSVKDEATTDAAVRDEMAGLILTDFSYLKLTEVMLFLKWLKTGKYGELYGRINPQNFFCKLRQFEQERGVILDRYENEQNTKRLIEARNKAISYEDYKKKHAKE